MDDVPSAAPDGFSDALTVVSGRMSAPIEHQVHGVVASDAAGYVNGTNIDVDGGFLAQAFESRLGTP